MEGCSKLSFGSATFAKFDGRVFQSWISGGARTAKYAEFCHTAPNGIIGFAVSECLGIQIRRPLRPLRQLRQPKWAKTPSSEPPFHTRRRPGWRELHKLPQIIIIVIVIIIIVIITRVISIIIITSIRILLFFY